MSRGKVHGKIEDKDAFMKALRTLDIKDSFRGLCASTRTATPC